MLKVKIFCLLFFAFAFGSAAYGQNSGRDMTADLYKTTLDNLIKRGRHLDSQADSLPVLIKDFHAFAKLSHNPAADVYANFYAAQFQWLAADHYKAMQLAIASLNGAQKYNVTAIQPDIYALIGALHKENSNYPMAFVAAEKGLSIARKNNDTAEIIGLIGQKAMFKRGFSLHYSKPLDKDSSLELRLEGLKIAESNPKYERLRIPFYDNLAQHYKSFKQYDKAKFYAEKGIALSLKYNQRRSLTYGYDWLGEAYYLSGDKKNGELYLNKALAMTITLKQPFRKMEIYEAMADCYVSSNDYKLAYGYLTKYRWLHDSLQVQDNEKKIGEMQIKYESSKKDKTLSLLNLANKQKSRQLKWLMAGAILFLLLIVILVYLYNIIRENNKVLVANNIQINTQTDKLQTLMQELHHRVKNNLQIVSSLLGLQSNRMADNEARDALNVSRQRIEAMSIIHNSLYQHDSANKVNMEEFLSVLLNSIQESFGMANDDIDISTEILINEIDVDIAMPLGLIINEWVTNIFKHAYKDMDERRSIEILFFQNADKLKLKIRDNGIGMPLESWDNPHGSFGVKLMKILIKQISGVSYISNSKGTTLELDIPYHKND